MLKGELTEAHLTYMNIGRRYWGADVSTLLSHQRKPLQPYLEKFGQCLQQGIGLFVWGENSTGKTYVTAALCKEAWKRFRINAFCTTAAELKDCWIQDRPLADGETFTQRIEKVRLLVIDDLGKEYRAASGFAENKFAALLRTRAREKLTTIVTTNLTPAEFKEVYGLSSGELAKECMYPVRFEPVNVRSMIAKDIGEKFGGQV